MYQSGAFSERSVENGLRGLGWTQTLSKQNTRRSRTNQRDCGKLQCMTPNISLWLLIIKKIIFVQFVHNYGHGGYGVTLAPGTVKYAVNLLSSINE